MRSFTLRYRVLLELHSFPTRRSSDLRSRAATEGCRNRRRLFREFTPGWTRGEKKHRQDQGGRKQTVFAKCLQDKRLNSDQERRNHQSRAGKIEDQAG